MFVWRAAFFAAVGEQRHNTLVMRGRERPPPRRGDHGPAPCSRGVAHARVNVFVASRCVPGAVIATTAERAPLAVADLDANIDRGGPNSGSSYSRRNTAITRSIFELCSAPSRLVASLRPRVQRGAAFGP